MNGYLFLDGLFSVIRGALEIATFPLTWEVKPIIKGLVTLAAFLVSDPTKVENNSGIKNLANLGVTLLNTEDDNSLNSSNKTMYRLLAISSDIHRKFTKSLKRGQTSSVELDELKAFYKIRSSTKPVKKEEFNELFSLFTQKEKPCCCSAKAGRFSNTYLFNCSPYEAKRNTGRVRLDEIVHSALSPYTLRFIRATS